MMMKLQTGERTPCSAAIMSEPSHLLIPWVHDARMGTLCTFVHYVCMGTLCWTTLHHIGWSGLGPCQPSGVLKSMIVNPNQLLPLLVGTSSCITGTQMNLQRVLCHIDTFTTIGRDHHSAVTFHMSFSAQPQWGGSRTLAPHHVMSDPAGFI
jgi:hypothetical protein